MIAVRKAHTVASTKEGATGIGAIEAGQLRGLGLWGIALVLSTATWCVCEMQSLRPRSRPGPATETKRPPQCATPLNLELLAGDVPKRISCNNQDSDTVEVGPAKAPITMQGILMNECLKFKFETTCRWDKQKWGPKIEDRPSPHCFGLAAFGGCSSADLPTGSAKCQEAYSS